MGWSFPCMAARLIQVSSSRRPRRLSALCMLSALAIVFTPANAESPTGLETPRVGGETIAQVLAPPFGEGIWRYQTVPEPIKGKSPLPTSQGVLSAVAALVLAAFATVALIAGRHLQFRVPRPPACPRGPPPG